MNTGLVLAHRDSSSRAPGLNQSRYSRNVAVRPCSGCGFSPEWFPSRSYGRRCVCCRTDLVGLVSIRGDRANMYAWTRAGATVSLPGRAYGARRPYCNIWSIVSAVYIMLTRNSRGNGRFPREWTVSTVIVVDVHGVTTLRLVCRSNFEITLL